MDVVFVHSRIRTNMPPQHAPYGILQLAALTDMHGFKTAILDNNAHRLPIDAVRQELKNAGDKEGAHWDVIGIGGITSQYRFIKDLVKVCREEHPAALIVAGGGFLTSQPRMMMKWLPEFDIGCIGESILTWPEVLEHVDDRNWKRVKGLVYREGKKIKFSTMRPLIPEEDLDEEVPWPGYEFSPVQTYLMNSRIPYCEESMRPNTLRLDVLASYGCSYHCSFCFHSGFTPHCQSQIYNKKVTGKAFRQHSPKYVVDLIMHLRLNYQINFVSFIDENFTINRKWFMAFCKELEESGLPTLGSNPIRWGILAHTRTVDKVMLEKGRDCGLSYISYGGETASEKLLKDCHKGQTKEQMAGAIDVTQDAGINAIMTFIIGFPDTTVDDLIEDLQFYLDKQIHCIPFYLQPYPSTEIFKEYKDVIIEQYLTDEEKDFLSDPSPHSLLKVYPDNPKPSKSLVKKRFPFLKEDMRDKALERWVLALDDATKLSANLTSFNDVELAGLRYMLSTDSPNLDRSVWDMKRLKDFKKVLEARKKQ